MQITQTPSNTYLIINYLDLYFKSRDTKTNHHIHFL